ncbi:hypothetical protein C8D77_102497 [Mesorhizobium loti]|uniref:DUF5681 domain-containing protein n=1 Tax=Rhizobium loti TaxID=381 RepID=A0A8E3B690_RHILI|nr:DUF5681 domain-containing protein [Mesorhizobium loti]PWJ92722.1 hypothetical protein C8D77_102497 [Mesorhizobium loti]
MDEKKPVGYKNPPRETRFKKGRSGNPKGRPPRIKSASVLLANELDKIIVVRESGQEIKLTKREALITSLVNDAITGKNQARQLLLKILDVSTPAEAFVTTDEDHAAFDAYVSDLTKKDPDYGDGSNGQVHQA